MQNSVSAQADMFAPELSDDALERAAAVGDRQRLTIGICTDWYFCNWPLSPDEQATGGAAGQGALIHSAVTLPS